MRVLVVVLELWSMVVALCGQLWSMVVELLSRRRSRNCSMQTFTPQAVFGETNLLAALLGSGMVLDGSRKIIAAGLLEAQRIWLHLRLWKHWTLIKWHLPSCLKTVQRKKESRTCSGAIREKH